MTKAQDSTEKQNSKVFTPQGRETGASGFGENQFTRESPFGENQFTGCLADLADARDEALIQPAGSRLFGPPLTEEQIRIDIESLVPNEAGEGAEIQNWNVPVYDQRPYRSCVSCAVSSVLSYLDPPTAEESSPARLFVFYNARALEGTQAEGTVGTGIRTAVKAVNKFGACEEQLWPYIGTDVTKEPDLTCYQSARYIDGVGYRRVFRRETGDSLNRLAPVRRAITNGHPVICGFTVYPSFKQAEDNGIVELPDEDYRDFVPNFPTSPRSPAENALWRNVTFGHCAVIIGFDGESFTMVNSWGTSWGDSGRFTMPADYLADSGLTSDFWTVTSLTNGNLGRKGGGM